jgi:glycosyltransferase involved in cell wall biosynthesis
MKVLHITTSSKGGAGIAAFRLHQALCKNGVVSAFISTNVSIDYNNKVVIDDFFDYKKPSFLKKIINKFNYIFSISNKHKLIREFHNLKPKMHCEIATLPFSNYKLHEHPLVKEADVINLHWIDGIIDYQSFFLSCKKPIVWTFHDMNPFQGIFHYHEDEIRNLEIAETFDAKIKKIKKSTFNYIEKGTFITPSKWLFQEANQSQVFTDFDKFHIPYSIDFDVFKLQDKISLRKEYAIKENEFVILFVSDNIENPRKGFDLLIESLAFLKDIVCTILIVGKGNIPLIDNLKIISFGEISSLSQMAVCYALADVFVLPSREDNLPNVMLESFACGTPMIGFNVGGIAEHTIESLTGILANELTGFSLAEAIVKFSETRQEYKRHKIRKYAQEHFNNKQQSELYTALYNIVSR